MLPSEVLSCLSRRRGRRGSGPSVQVSASSKLLRTVRRTRSVSEAGLEKEAVDGVALVGGGIAEDAAVAGVSLGFDEFRGEGRSPEGFAAIAAVGLGAGLDGDAFVAGVEIDTAIG